MLGNIPWRYRIPRNAPPFEGESPSFLFLSGDFDAGVLNQMVSAISSGSIAWVVVPVSEHAFRMIRKAGPLLMQIDLTSIGSWGIGL